MAKVVIRGLQADVRARLERLARVRREPRWPATTYPNRYYSVFSTISGAPQLPPRLSTSTTAKRFLPLSTRSS
jgi:hypothetical protein